MRLIDADKIKYWEIDEVGGEYSPYMGCSKEYIDEMPTISIIEELEKLRTEFHERNVTNGEILKALFPKDFDGTKAVIKEADWWNSPYAKGENKCIYS